MHPPNCARAAKFGFVKFRYRLHAETAKKELHDRPAFGGLCPSIQIGECLENASHVGEERCEGWGKGRGNLTYLREKGTDCTKDWGRKGRKRRL